MTLPLDIASGALVAYSNRALSTAAKGTALYTIRRSTDSTTQSFNSDASSGDAPVSTITTFLGVGTGFIATWTDQSGNGSNAVQATAGKQPGWIASANGGRPGISFPSVVTNIIDNSGTSFFLAPASDVTFPSGVFTCFAVVQVNQTDPNTATLHSNFLWGLTGATTSAQFDISPTTNDPATIAADSQSSDGTNAAGGVSVAAAGLYTNYIVLDGELAYGTWGIALNGSDLDRAENDDSGGALGSFAGALSIGCGAATETSPLNALYGHLQELIIYPTILSSSVRAAIRANIASYYGITIAASSTTARIPGFPPVAEVGTDEAEHRRQLARMFNRLNQGKFNCTV